MRGATALLEDGGSGQENSWGRLGEVPTTSAMIVDRFCCFLALVRPSIHYRVEQIGEPRMYMCSTWFPVISHNSERMAATGIVYIC